MRHDRGPVKFRRERKSSVGATHLYGVERLASAWKISGMSDTLLSRFLRYVQIDTQSDETSKTFPSTSGQLVLLEMLKQELTELGAADVQMTRHGYVLASIPANTRKARVPTVAFLAHVDTAPDCSGKNVKPIVHRKYDGRVMKFPDKPGLTLDPATSPEYERPLEKTS